MFFYRDPEEIEREALEKAALASAEAGAAVEIGGQDAQNLASDWEVANTGAGGAAAAAAANLASGSAGDAGLDWAAENGATGSSDWAADGNQAGAAQQAPAATTTGWE